LAYDEPFRGLPGGFSLQRGIANSGRFIPGGVASSELTLHQNKTMTLQIRINEAALPANDAT
jgi:hypothetical protein